MKKFKLIRKIIQVVAFFPVTIMLINNLTYFSTFLIILTSLAGAFYCGYLCPFGFLQELASILGYKLKIKKKSVPKNLNIILKSIRYILYLLITVLAISIVFSLLKYDARSNLYLFLSGKRISYAMILSILIFFVLSLFYKKPFCNYLCIKGAGYGILSKFRLFSIKRDSSSCVNCKKCDKACDMGIRVSTLDSVNSMSCINCFECIRECPVKNTLTFGLLPSKDIRKKLIFAVFAGVFLLGYFYQIPENVTTTSPDKEKVVSKKSVEKKDKKSKVDNATYYTGEAQGYQDVIKVKVGIENGKITKISITDHNEDWDWYSQAKDPIIDTVIQKQSADVDVVSGATYTSKGIINAIKNALEQVRLNKN